MTISLTIEALRAELGITQTEFALRLGLANKASVSLIERGGPCSPTVALAIERLSGGRIDAGSLNPVVAAARVGMADQRTHDGTSAIDDAPDPGARGWELTAAEIDALPGALPDRPGFAGLDLAKGADMATAPARVVLCDVCDARLDGTTVRACTFVDCPHAAQEAA